MILSSPVSLHSFTSLFTHSFAPEPLEVVCTWRSGEPFLLREVGVSMTTVGQAPNAETFLQEASDGGRRYCDSLPARLPAPALVPFRRLCTQGSCENTVLCSEKVPCSPLSSPWPPQFSRRKS